MVFVPDRRTWALMAVALLLFSDAFQTLCQQPQSGNTAALLAQGKKAEAQGEFARALGDYQAALQSDPDNAEVNFRIGLLKGQNRDFAGAASAFRRALRTKPNFPEARYNLGLAIVAESKNSPDWRRALIEFRAALVLRPDYPEASNMAGVSMLETGEPAKAISQFKAALLFNPGSAEIHFNLGRSLEAAGDASQAYAEYLAAVQHRSAYPEAEDALGNLLFTRMEYVSAADRFQAALTADPDLEGAHYGLAKGLKSQGKSAEAQIEFRQASALLQRQSDAIRSSHLSNESLELARQGNFPSAIHSAREALELEPENGIAHYNLGLLLADSTDLSSAILELRKAISLEPLQSSFYTSLSRMQEKMGNREGAIDSLRQAVLLSPANPRLKAKLKALQAALPSAREGQLPSKSAVLFPNGAPSDTAADHFAFATRLSKEGDLPGAIGELLRALELEPVRGDIRYNLAIAYTETGEYDKAELELRKVLLRSPDAVEAHVALGIVLLQSKDDLGAAAEFRRGLALQPGNLEAARLLSQCQVRSQH
jgi:tetratricopeptide (TPR) repeat protein